MLFRIFTSTIGVFLLASELFAQNPKPLRLGVAGLVHDHVHGILGRPDRGDIEIVGIAEANQELVARLCERYKISRDIVYPDLETMLEKTQPEAVSVFSSIYDHLAITEKCAARGIHVMVEKPLAVSLDHALKMQKAAQAGGIQLITNYETTWYASNHKVAAMVKNKTLGEVRKMVIHDGHSGPREIGCSEEFLAWLTDPVANGGGAITDFGCYGANLATWVMAGQRPVSVTAITQQIKPDIYPKVDDEATIIVTYPQAQAIIQASWNWPVSRKDFHVYGKTGYAKTLNSQDMVIRINEESAEYPQKELPLSAPLDDAFSFFAGVVRGTLDPAGSPGSLEINMVAMEILDAAIQSAKKGKRVYLKK
ncbi:MAG: Gfo/Idh/MocA family oxidoreductase [Bacteroidia bacterium]|nr:Gfo/Idh/MocA family oxidoreductase [Bacteroidia bacterium]